MVSLPLPQAKPLYKIEEDNANLHAAALPSQTNRPEPPLPIPPPVTLGFLRHGPTPIARGLVISLKQLKQPFGLRHNLEALPSLAHIDIQLTLILGGCPVVYDAVILIRLAGLATAEHLEVVFREWKATRAPGPGVILGGARIARLVAIWEVLVVKLGDVVVP